jgi:hypothetical protein
VIELPLATLRPYDPAVVLGGGGMRFLLGLILGSLLTIGGAYIADSREDPAAAHPMVNWDVVGQKLAVLTEDAKQKWDEFTRQMTGPP